MPRSYTYAQKVRKILRIALPSGANSLLDTLVLALGIFFVGRFGEEYIAALSVGMQFVMMFFAINAVFYIGTNTQISRLYGERNSERAGRVFSTLMLLCLACGAPILALAWFGLEPFIAWIGISEHTGALSKAFLMISIFSLPAVLLKNIIVSAFSAIGDTLSIFLVRIATTAFCVVINYALIIAAQLDIIGAAWAGLITSYVELFIFCLLAWRRGRFFAFSFGITWRYFYIALKIGIPSGIERLLTLGSLVLTTKIIANFGDVAVTGAQIDSRIEAFAFMPGFGFMVAAMALTGQNLGAKRIDVAMDLNKTILQISSIVMGILGVLMAVFAAPLSRIFNANDAVVAVSIMYLLAVGFSQIPLIWAFVLDGVLRASGITNLSLAINALSIWCFRILPIWVGVKMAGLGIWWVFVVIFVETYIRAVIFYAFYRAGMWKKPNNKFA